MNSRHKKLQSLQQSAQYFRCTFQLGKTFLSVANQMSPSRDFQKRLTLIFYNTENQKLSEEKVNFDDASDENVLNFTLQIPHQLYFSSWSYNYKIDSQIELGTRRCIQNKNQALFVDEWNKQTLIIRLKISELPNSLTVSYEEYFDDECQTTKQMKLIKNEFYYEGQESISLQTKLVNLRFSSSRNESDSFQCLKIAKEQFKIIQNALVLNIEEIELIVILEHIFSSKMETRTVNTQINQGNEIDFDVDQPQSSFLINSEQNISFSEYFKTQNNSIISFEDQLNKSLNHLVNNNDERQKIFQSELLQLNERKSTILKDQELFFQKLKDLLAKIPETHSLNSFIQEVNLISKQFTDAADQKIAFHKFKIQKQRKTIFDQHETQQCQKEKIQKLKSNYESQIQIKQDYEETQKFLEEKIKQLKSINNKFLKQIELLKNNQKVQQLIQELQNIQEIFQKNEVKLQELNDQFKTLQKEIKTLQIEKDELRENIKRLEQIIGLGRQLNDIIKQIQEFQKIEGESINRLKLKQEVNEVQRKQISDLIKTQTKENQEQIDRINQQQQMIIEIQKQFDNNRNKIQDLFFIEINSEMKCILSNIDNCKTIDIKQKLSLMHQKIEQAATEREQQEQVTNELIKLLNEGLQQNKEYNKVINQTQHYNSNILLDVEQQYHEYFQLLNEQFQLKNAIFERIKANIINTEDNMIAKIFNCQSQLLNSELIPSKVKNHQYKQSLVSNNRKVKRVTFFQNDDFQKKIIS